MIMHWVRVKFCQGLLLISASKMSSYTGTKENFHHFMRLNIPERNDDGKIIKVSEKGRSFHKLNLSDSLKAIENCS